MYPLIYQKNMTSEKWNGYPRSQQILSIANEMNRAQNALLKGNLENAEHAWERAFELTDLTIEGSCATTLLKELLRFREMLGAVFVNPDPSTHLKLMEAFIALDPGAYNALHSFRN